MKITLLEPFFSGSHRQWALGFQSHFPHPVKILSLPGRHWKWRMHGGAVSLAKQFLKIEELPDLILATSMLDLTTFLGLTRQKSQSIPVALYFHENQITYPWSPDDPDPKLRRDNHYGFINYTAALAANQIFFNSRYHLNSFVSSLPDFLKQFPDYQALENIEAVQAKSEVLSLGMDLRSFDPYRIDTLNEVPIILWNHRWEYDKNPESFYKALCDLRAVGAPFRLVILGESYVSRPPVFQKIEETFRDVILHFGYVENFSEYARWLWRSDILVVTSKQEFFGGSVVEGIYCGCTPLLPDRLAYPEHIPTELRQKFIYADETDLEVKLQALVRSNQCHADQQILSDFVARYDWSILAKDYVESLQRIR
jgi:glycosyltransferase involved in cell wall biosynthesis